MTGFSSQWLSLREASDAAARAPDLAARLPSTLTSAAPLQVLDLGSGTGANLRYLAPLLRCPQDWALVDDDPALLALLPRTLTAWARQQGCQADAGHQYLAVHGAALQCRIELRRLDLAAELHRLDIPAGALVTASALLDLVSSAWLDRLAQACAAARATALFALSYDGRVSLAPEDALDSTVVELVNRHQLTDKGFGPALGPAAASAARELFGAVNYRTESARSDWQLGAKQSAMQSELLRGWFEAASSMAPQDAGALQVWHAQRQVQSAAGLLRIQVGHEDLLAWPKQP
jgi:SAM-dependent methyltransferase